TLALPENELHSVRLTNTLGCAVWALSEASGITTLDVGGLSAGVYFVEVQSARRRSVQKVVKY
ncbi:MAG: T9SS type A sorting domain-containing protein, partial [Candidatus Kapabacteria bacterium]|nr:T9SS type A sorting domain-containing protein [Candidatus Kapabacteria bacterium]